jgi:hypothetical protein
MKKIDHLSSKSILIGNPTLLNGIEKGYKDKIIEIIIPEADILFSFGYGTSLEQLASSLSQSVTYKLTCVEKSH